MAYTPPVTNAVNFELTLYVPPAADIVPFTLDTVPVGTTLTVKAMLSMDHFGGGTICAQ